MSLPGVGIGIIGPPRSGTSSAALFLEQAGFYLGAPEDIGAADQFNADGYREHRQINDLNFETDWLYLLPGETHTPLLDTWDEHPLADHIVTRTHSVLGGIFGSASYWCWKDPRTTLLLPIYQRALAGTNVGYLAMVRHPVGCARSISRRDGCSLDIALGIWIEHTLSSLKFLFGSNCRFVAEAEWLDSPQQAVADLLESMGVDPERLDLEHASAAVKSELRTTKGEEPTNLEFADRCYEVALAAALHPSDYRSGQLNDRILELWAEWQEWREVRNSRRARVEISLETNRGSVEIFVGLPGPPWHQVNAPFEAREARLKIHPVGNSIFLRAASLMSGSGRRIPLRFGMQSGSSCGWSPEGVCRICTWTNEGLPIMLPGPGAYELEMQVQHYPTPASAIDEALRARAGRR